MRRLTEEDLRILASTIERVVTRPIGCEARLLLIESVRRTLADADAEHVAVLERWLHTLMDERTPPRPR